MKNLSGEGYCSTSYAAFPNFIPKLQKRGYAEYLLSNNSNHVGLQNAIPVARSS